LEKESNSNLFLTLSITDERDIYGGLKNGILGGKGRREGNWVRQETVRRLISVWKLTVEKGERSPFLFIQRP